MPVIYPGSKGKMPNFLATGLIFSPSPEGRKTMPLNGIRWNIASPVDMFEPGDGITLQYSNWPIFVSEKDEVIEGILEPDLTYRTYLYSLSDDSIAGWMKPGAEFFFMEGGRRVGQGRIVSKL